MRLLCADSIGFEMELSLEVDASFPSGLRRRGRPLPTFLPFITWLRITLRPLPFTVSLSTNWNCIFLLNTARH